MVCSKSQRYVFKCLKQKRRGMKVKNYCCRWKYECRFFWNERVRWDPKQRAKFWSALPSPSAKSSPFVAEKKKKPDMWNHFSLPVLRVRCVAGPLEKQRHLHRFPSPLLLLQVFGVEMNCRLKPCPKVSKSKGIHWKILEKRTRRYFMRVCFCSVGLL